MYRSRHLGLQQIDSVDCAGKGEVTILDGPQHVPHHQPILLRRRAKLLAPGLKTFAWYIMPEGDACVGELEGKVVISLIAPVAVDDTAEAVDLLILLRRAEIAVSEAAELLAAGYGVLGVVVRRAEEHAGDVRVDLGERQICRCA